MDLRYWGMGVQVRYAGEKARRKAIISFYITACL